MRGTTPFRWSSLAVAAVGWLLCVACKSAEERFWDRSAEVAATLPAGAVQVAEYAGQYVDDPRLPSALAALTRAAEGARHRVGARLGVPDLEVPPLSVCVVDGEVLTIDAFAGTRLLRTESGTSVGVILFATQAVVSGVVDLDAVMAHEVAHVLQASWSGDAELPAWLSEGLAHWIELPEEVKCEEWVLDYGLRDQPDAHHVSVSHVLASEARLSSADFRAQDAAGTAVFLMLTRTRGTEFVRRLVVALLRATDWRAVFEAECGAPFSGILHEVRDEFALWGSSIREVTDVINEAGRDCEAGDHPAALRRLNALLSGDAPASMRGWVERARWGVQLDSGDPAAARASIREFRLRRPHHPLVIRSWIDELHVLAAQEQWSELRSVAAMVTRDLLWLERGSAQRDAIRSLLLTAPAETHADPVGGTSRQ